MMPPEAPDGKLAGQACVITGATSGIGLATARLFRAHGARLAIMARDRQAVDAAAAELGPHAVAVTGDVARVADLTALMRAANDAYGGIDVVVANAGIGRFAPLEAVTEDDFDALCAVHLRGTFFTVQAALPYLRPGAAVVLISSAGAQRGFPTTSVYNAVKAGVRSLGRTFAAELAPRGIRINTVSPGLTETPMVTGDPGLPPEHRDEAARQQLALIPLRRLGRPEEIAATILFLASDDASFYTGADLTPDGGTRDI
jgi:NAD(P)-dependent dehydrogenase (short-subunit alcohol dehydrogenase family)